MFFILIVLGGYWTDFKIISVLNSSNCVLSYFDTFCDNGQRKFTGIVADCGFIR